MKALNNKGMSIIEVVITFTLIMFFATGLLIIIVNYRNTVSVSLEKLKLDTFKDSISQDINNDILTLGLREVNTEGECSTLTDLNRCVNFVFKDGTQKAFGTSKVIANNKDSIINKYLYYDGLKYKLKDSLPDKIPADRTYADLQQISIFDGNILEHTYTVLEDGTKINIYSVNVSVFHVDFNDDFGVHIVASDE